MNSLFLKIIFGVIISSSLFFSCKTKERETLKVATSANMQFVMQDICTAFQTKTGIKSELIIGSSGKLTAQILAGAPFDLFVAADMNFPQKIKEANLNSSENLLYTHGQLVIWSNKEDDVNYLDLNREAYKKIAIANPVTAPYGAAAKAFINAQFGDQLNHKLIYAESISQVNQYILSNNVDVGISSIFIVNSPQNIGKGFWEVIPNNLYSPIEQGLIGIKGPNDKKTQELIQFILSNQGQKIISAYSKTSKYSTIINDEELSLSNFLTLLSS